MLEATAGMIAEIETADKKEEKNKGKRKPCEIEDPWREDWDKKSYKGEAIEDGKAQTLKTKVQNTYNEH